MKSSFRFLFVFLIVLLIVSLTVVLVYALSAFLTIQNYGLVKAVGTNIYQDADCTIALTHIDWGMVEADSTILYEGWLRNEGNVPVTVTLYTENWVPENTSDFMTLTWDCEGASVAVNEVVSCVFALEIYGNVMGITNFGFDIILVGSET